MDVVEMHHSDIKDIRPRTLVSMVGTFIKSKTVLFEIMGDGGKDGGNNLLISCRCVECNLIRPMRKGDLHLGRGCGCVSGSGIGATERNKNMVGTIVNDGKRHLEILEYHETIRVDSIVKSPPHFSIKCHNCLRVFPMGVSPFIAGHGCGCVTNAGYGATERNKKLVGTVVKGEKRNLKILEYHSRKMVGDYDRSPGYDIECLDCGRLFFMTSSHLRHNASCGCINGAGGGGTRVNEKEIGKTFEEHNRRFTVLSYHKRGTGQCGTQLTNRYGVVCLDCSRKFEMSVSSFRDGSGGCLCRRIPFSESFMVSLLEEKGIPYEHDVQFSWSDRKRYDIFIPHLKTIIELHGAQHYEDVPFWDSTAEGQRKNDEYKRKLATDNGILHYYEVNCSGRGEDHLVESFRATLPDHLFDILFRS